MYANRDDRIRTYDHSLPKRVLYQTELRPDVKQYTITYVICQTVPSVPNRICERPTFLEWVQRPMQYTLALVSMDCLKSMLRSVRSYASSSS